MIMVTSMIIMLLIGIFGGFISGLVGIGSNYHLSYAFIITTFGWSTHL